jgi:glutaredoxin
MLNRFFRTTDKPDTQPVLNALCYDIVMYSRSTGCPFITVAKRVLNERGVPYHEIMIDQDPEARERVRLWTGFLSVPTLVIAEKDHLLPYQDILPLPRGTSPRGLDRGAMITEPSDDELLAWLKQHGFIE